MNTMRTRMQLPMFGSAMLLLVLGMILDSSVIGLQRPAFERARRQACAGRGSGGSALGGGGGSVNCGSTMMHMQAWAGRLCLRGGAEDMIHDKDPLMRGAKRPRRPDGTVDANYVESLHSAMARADATKYMNPKVRPSHPTQLARDVDGGDVVMRGVETSAGGAGGAQVTGEESLQHESLHQYM